MIIGLTGGIATGKTTVLKMFENFGATVVSADVLGHKALHSTGGAYQAVRERFGFLPGLLDDQGEINRRALGMHVFLNRDEMDALDDIIHPVVSRMFSDLSRGHQSKIIIYECAILYECNLDREIDFKLILSTDCPFETQVERLMARNGMNRNEALMRIEQQLPSKQKRYLSDIAIDTSVSPKALETRINGIYSLLLTLLVEKLNASS